MSNKATPSEITKAMDNYKRLWKPDGVEGMTLIQLETKKEALRKSLKELEAIPANCTHCVHFQIERCEFHKQDVPVEFQQTQGECPDWVYDGIPF